MRSHIILNKELQESTLAKTFHNAYFHSVGFFRVGPILVAPFMLWAYIYYLLYIYLFCGSFCCGPFFCGPFYFVGPFVVGSFRVGPFLWALFHGLVYCTIFEVPDFNSNACSSIWTPVFLRYTFDKLWLLRLSTVHAKMDDIC